MSQLQKAWLAVAGAGLVLLAVLGRYEVVVGSRGDGAPPAYLLDRWTGNVQSMVYATIRDVTPPEPPKAGAAQGQIYGQARSAARPADEPASGSSLDNFDFSALYKAQDAGRLPAKKD